LLARRLAQIARIARTMHLNLGGAVLDEFGDIRAERGVSAAVNAIPNLPFTNTCA